MNLKTLKRGLTLNKNITDKGGNFDYYIAKVGHLKKNIAIGKYSIFTEAVGNYKEVARIEYDDEIEFINDDTKEAQWFEGLARTIADKYEGEEDIEEEEEEEEEKKLKKDARDILREMREKREKATSEEVSTNKDLKSESSIAEKEQNTEKDIKKNESKEDFEKKLTKIKDEIKNIKKETKSNSVEKEIIRVEKEEKDLEKSIIASEQKYFTDNSNKGKKFGAKIWKSKNLNQQKTIEQDDNKNKFSLKKYLKSKKSEDKQSTEEKNSQTTPNINLLKKYLKQGTKAGFPASKQFLFAIGYVFYSNINLFQKLFLSVLLLSSSIMIFFTSLFFLPIYLLEKINKKLINKVKRQIKKDKNKNNSSKMMKIILIELPIILFVLSLYIPIILFIFLLFSLLRTISFSIIFISLLAIITLILSFGYLFYEENILYIFHEEFDLKEHKKTKRKKKDGKKNILKTNKEKEIEKEAIKREEKREKEFKNLNQEEQRQYDIIEAFIISEHELGITTKKVIHKKIDKITNEQNIGNVLTKELLISINRKLIMENKKITDYKELLEAFENKKILGFFI